MPDLTSGIPRETVASFAEELRKDPAVLLDQLRKAGVHKDNVDCIVTDTDKSRLLTYLKQMHGTFGDRKKISLIKRQTSSKSTLLNQSPKSKATSKNLPIIILAGNIEAATHSTECSRMFMEAYLEVFRAFPRWHEFESFKLVYDRIKALREAVCAGDPNDLLDAIRRCFDGVTSGRSATVLAHIVIRILQPFFARLDNLRLAIAWSQATTAAAQTKLKARCRRAANTAVATLAWRLRRQKRWLPACAATISLV